MKFFFPLLLCLSTASPPPYVSVPWGPGSRYRAPQVTHGIFHKYNTEHVLPLRDSSVTPDYFENILPVVIRVKVLAILARTRNQPGVEMVLSRIMPRLNIPEELFPDTVQYIKYICSFQHMDSRVHERLIQINREEIDTDANAVALEFRAQGFPEYITAERIFEWYRILFNCHRFEYNRGRVLVNNLMKRYAVGVNWVVSFPPQQWGDRFVAPRLRRLLTTGYEHY